MRLERIGALLALLVLGWVASELGVGGSVSEHEYGQTRVETSGLEHVDEPDARRERLEAPAADPGGLRIAQAFAERESGFMTTVEGTVAKLLPDDREGSRHQRFLLRVEGAPRSLLVAHNIDLAERVPVERGDRLRLRGQFEWNEKGGVLHWTHRDPEGRHPGGWIEIEGRRID